MSITAMKQWLEALELSKCTAKHEQDCHVCNAIESLRQAIEQAEKQEPVGYFSVNDYGNWEQNESNYGEPFYTAPQVTPQVTPQEKREWVGLTDEELERICYETFSYDPYVIARTARAIEAKLKEKNT